MTNAEELARILFENYKAAKIKRGITKHVTEHNSNPQNILAVSWDELNPDDKAFDLEIVEASMKEMWSK